MVGDDLDGYTEGEEPMVFHYKKGDFRRLEPKMYSDMATGQNQPKRGFFRVLVNTKGNRMIFFSMIFCFALVFIVWIVNSHENVSSSTGITCELTSFSFEGKVYASLSLKNNKKNPLTEEKPLSVEFDSYDTDGTLINKETVQYDFVPEGEEQFVRVVFSDYNLAEVKCSIKSENSADKEILLTSKVLQR